MIRRGLLLAYVLVALLATAAVTANEECAEEGKRAIQCGAKNGPLACCAGLVCPTNGKKQCVESKEKQKEAEPAAPVEVSDLLSPSGTTSTTSTSTPSEEKETILENADSVQQIQNIGSGASFSSFGNIDLLRPAINGIKHSGGIASAVFGTRTSRKWDVLLSTRNIQQLKDPERLNSSHILLERDPFRFTEVPSASPSEFPTAMPSESPTSSPSSQPTSFPTDYLWVSEPLPLKINDEYFDYNPNSARGPQSWHKVDDAPETKHWDELKKYIDADLDDNECGNTQSRRQSPIDVRFDRSEGMCFEYHEIRHSDGEFSVADPKVDAKILPTKLRIDYPYVVIDPDDLKKMNDKKRPTWSEVKWETDDDGEKKFIAKDAVKGPSADIPKGWGYQLPVTHVDIKIPSEHWMEGKQYVAEFQIYLIQNRKAQRGAPAISILIDLDPEDKPNAALQVALDRFQLEWDKDMTECKAKQIRKRRLGATLKKENSTTQEMPTQTEEFRNEEEQILSNLRRLQDRSNQGNFPYFSPWDEEIMRSIWFFGYEGSLTEPPCTEFLEWRIIDTPTTVSMAQLFQMKKLLFHHVDGDCKRTSTHYEGSVARPLQPYNGRLVHRCMCRDFFSDEQRRKKNLDKRRCDEDDQEDFGFDTDIFSESWFDRTHKYTTPAHQNCRVFGDCQKYNEELAAIREAQRLAALAAAREAAEKAAKKAQREREEALKKAQKEREEAMEKARKKAARQASF